VRTSYWLRDVGFAGLIVTLVACNTQSGALPTAASAKYRPEAEKPVSGELLYASVMDGSEVIVFSYPQGTYVETLTGFADPPYFLCSDGNGDVFVPTTDLKSPGYIYEFAHGGTQPIETLTDPGPGWAQSCSVDPTTGNLAVANGEDVAIYAHGQGTPTVYEASDVGAWDLAYDDSGDLFVDGKAYGYRIAELPAGGTSFSDIALSKATGTLHLQWRRNRLVLYGGTYGPHGPYRVFQVRVSGSNGIVSGPVNLYGKNKHRQGLVEFALSGSTIVMPEGPSDSVPSLWHYPKGGRLYEVINLRPHNAFYGVAISK
jgi:hypothetical protein